MHIGANVPRVSNTAFVSDALLEMTAKKLGMTAIVDVKNRVLGLFTDGDLRRMFEGTQCNIHTTLVTEVMTAPCITIKSDILAAEALRIMENNKITALLITAANDELIGALHMQRFNPCRYPLMGKTDAPDKKSHSHNDELITLKHALVKAKNIRLVIFDVDGVLTDGRLVFDESGREYKAFHARDGHGIKMLRNSGVDIAVISGRRSESVRQRMLELGIEHIFQGQKDKVASFNELCRKLPVHPKQVAHVGDDLPDLPIMQRVGMGIAVADAHFVVRKQADWCTSLSGGQGAVREICDLIMQAQGTWDSAVSLYLKPDAV